MKGVVLDGVSLGLTMLQNFSFSAAVAGFYADPGAMPGVPAWRNCETRLYETLRGTVTLPSLPVSLS